MENKNSLLRYVGYFILTLFILGAAFLGYERYMQWRGEMRVEALKQALEKWSAEENKEVLDEYGGKTPQDTLRMYIEAVEKGDYVLASKYFIYKNQKAELDSWNNSTKEEIQKYMSLVKGALQENGGYTPDKKEYVIEKPIYVDFKLLSNGIWKIIEI